MKYILTSLICASSLYGAASSKLASTMLTSPRTTLIEGLKKQHKTDDLGKLVHHVLDTAKLTVHTHVDFYNGEVTLSYELTHADVLKRLVELGANILTMNEHEKTPYARLHQKLTGTKAKRENGPILIKIRLMGSAPDEQKTHPFIVPVGKKISCGEHFVWHFELVGDPCADPMIQEILNMFNPET